MLRLKTVWNRCHCQKTFFHIDNVFTSAVSVPEITSLAFQRSDLQVIFFAAGDDDVEEAMLCVCGLGVLWAECNGFSW